mmetsp:Transcript_19624/g.28969  ORF Transcript_19624/g.28969 Transcript_19624/m.28969 type:complete len:158 (-) Transcript_19624:129-602(-)
MASAATMMLRNATRRSFVQMSRFNSPAVGSFRMLSSIKFAETHEYVKVEGNIASIGISDHAQTLLGDIVFVELPEVGDEIEKGETFTSVESVKAASDVYAPVSGTIVEVNESLADSPELVNEDAEGKAWFVKVEMSDPSEFDDLITPETYKASLHED